MRSLTLKLIIAFTVILALQALLVALLVRDANRKSLDKFVLEDALQVFVADVTSHYQAENSWEGVQESLGLRQGIPRPGGPRPGAASRPGRPGPGPGAPPPAGLKDDGKSDGKGSRKNNRRPPPRHGGAPTKSNIIHFGLADANGRVVFGAQNWRPDAVISEKERASSLPLEIDGQFVGSVLLPTTKTTLQSYAN